MIPLGEWLSRPPRSEAPTAAVADGAAAAAYDRGRRDAELASAAALEAARAGEQARCETALAEARAQWCEAEAAVLAARLGEAFAGLEQRIGSLLAAALEPFLAAEVRRQAVEGFATALKALAASGTGLIRLEAPADLLAALAARPGGIPPGVDCVHAEHAEILASGGATLIETAIASWLEAIAAASP